MPLYYVSFATLPQGTVINRYGCQSFFPEIFSFFQSALPKYKTRAEITAALVKFQSSMDIYDQNPEQTVGIFAREVVLENIRAREFAHRPSRIGSVFLTDDYKFAWSFLFRYRNGDGWIYECDASLQNIFKGDMNIVSHDRSSLTDSVFENSARIYWMGDSPLKFPEIICPDEVRIIGPANLVYCFDPITKTFIHSSHLPVNPWSGELVHLPNSTSQKPPAEEGATARFNGRLWELTASPS